MKLALIPPAPNLDDFEHNGFHMCLAQLLLDLSNNSYYDFYEERGNKKEFIILDNGAHECVSLKMKVLMGLALEIQASEVVFPDVPKNLRFNEARLDESLAWLQTQAGKLAMKLAPEMRYMVVPQVQFSTSQVITSRNYKTAAKRLLDKVTKVLPLDKVTVGIPSLYDDERNGSNYYGIVYQVEMLCEQYGVQLHLLGWPHNLALPRTIVRDEFNVRSIDAAKPFVMARHSQMFTSQYYKRYELKRPDNYFTSALTEEELNYARHNVQAFREAIEHSSATR